MAEHREVGIAKSILLQVLGEYHPILKPVNWVDVYRPNVFKMRCPPPYVARSWRTPPTGTQDYLINLSQITLRANYLLRTAGEHFKLSLSIRACSHENTDYIFTFSWKEVAADPTFAVVFRLLETCTTHPMVGITVKDGNPPEAHIFVRYCSPKDGRGFTESVAQVKLLKGVLQFTHGTNVLHSVDIGDPELEAKLPVVVHDIVRNDIANLRQGANKRYTFLRTECFSLRVGIPTARKRNMVVRHLMSQLSDRTDSRVRELRRQQAAERVLTAFDGGTILDHGSITKLF